MENHLLFKFFLEDRPALTTYSVLPRLEKTIKIITMKPYIIIETKGIINENTIAVIKIAKYIYPILFPPLISTAFTSSSTNLCFEVE